MGDLTAEQPAPLRLTDAMRERIDKRGDRALSAYYFDFDPTGNEHVDRILGAVARAGKLYHSTEWWNDTESAEDGHTLVDVIQAAANTAAAVAVPLSEEDRTEAFNHAAHLEAVAADIHPGDAFAVQDAANLLRRLAGGGS